MPDPILAALVGGVAALAIALISNFGLESFKRHRNASALAGGLAGELASQTVLIPTFIEGWEAVRLQAEANGRLTMLSSFNEPRQLVFESCVGELGTLGPELAEDVAFVYGTMAGYYRAIALAAAPESSAEQQLSSIESALRALKSMKSRAPKLVDALRLRAKAEWLGVPSSS